MAATKSPAPSSTSPAAVPTRRATGRPPVVTSRPRPPSPGVSSIAPPTSITSPAGYLSATAVLDRYSIRTWSQNDLTLTTTETITALDVTVKVAATTGMADTGRWSTVPGDLLTSTVTSTPAELVYHFTLNEGATLAPGAYTFAVQYLHTDTRDVTADSYTASATASAPTELTGHFTG